MEITYDDDSDAATEEIADARDTYTLDDIDVAKSITLVAKYSITTATDDTQTMEVNESDTDDVTLTSDSIGRVHSTNAPDGQPLISGVAQVGATLEVDKDSTSIDDRRRRCEYHLLVVPRRR